LSSLNCQSQTGSTLTINIFFYYIILDEKIIPLKSTLKTQSIYIFCIKNYITPTKIFKVKVEEEILKKSIVDNKNGTEGVRLFLKSSHVSLMIPVVTHPNYALRNAPGFYSCTEYQTIIQKTLHHHHPKNGHYTKLTQEV
jgi:hypothetical protein